MLRAAIVAVGLVLCCASALAAQAGRVVFIAGEAYIGARPAALEMAVQEGDALNTGADGYIYMKTVDDGFLILRPNSRARVITYHVDTANPANTRVKLELLSGVARSISGNAVKQARQHFRFNTPVAAIGVRGTDFIVHTNAHTSWVSVVSGGVVVSGFAGACGADGGGPCEGGASRELFAGRADAMLQVQRGQQVPQLLQNATIAPELNAPPRSDEPGGKPALGAKGGSAALDDVSLVPAKSTAPLLAGPVKLPDPVMVAPPVVIVQPEPVKPAPEILWGRWQAVAGQPADLVMIDKITADASKVQLLVGSYVLARPNNSSFVLPSEGKVSFALTGGEATLARIGGEPMVARIENAHLDIDFVDRTFNTGLSVVNALGKVDMAAHGDVTLRGTLENSPLNSPGFIVRGVLGGAKATEAAYTFKSTGAPQLGAAGITLWAR
ncbi:FecR family protein [Massilia psychrophila]|uniref:FecR protein domain-containing protein n=1 Tax=Massilia psychrophila TaxID=1603353 RepID=A0A2G8T358_9BURK|nr:FecR domain-containing protein [Massilia psychrophila]PIL40449.1 hypothetical protein CR103_07245 [Massilia psychrophila]GGE90166.1 hypothetical protein GCM10008020_39030 [Massilia psychrophila]